MEIREYLHYDGDEILRLYAAAGWTAYTADPEALRRGFSSSLLTLGAYEGDELMGLIRVIGDGATVILIQDLLVYPAYRRQGVGTALVKAVIGRYAHVRQIHLVTDDTPSSARFYASLGFKDHPSLGCRGYMYFGPRA